ncbi:hypothetical protein JN535_08640 [Cellulosimicrobium cellulans]|uniref:hypothetical protein n=1 Tax=Cellulosimicrobium cellulans TaxID=1710 RepID=UPI00196441B8|nr:hypothetical protein [Cellulosimicrobium cellulans]MBN0040229.1 hypothetical protein [Cellulosimicrobium cellulans]
MVEAPVNVSYAVMAHTARLGHALDLAESLDAALFVDDGRLGENANGDRAWAAADPDADWHVVLQDDAVLVAGFVDQVRRALAASPRTVVSFYVGTGMPFSTVGPVRYAISEATAVDAAWFATDALHWGVAVAMPTSWVHDYLATMTSDPTPYDQRIGKYAAAYRRSPVRYTWPSLVDHADGPTLVDHADGLPRVVPRRAYQVGTRSDWDTPPVWF